MEPYANTPIRAVNEEIRLLCLKPENWINNERIECSLEVVSLRDGERFYTLSYCWGDQTNKIKISCDGCDLFISQSLYHALRRIGDLGVRRIWIDQICINQSDLSERNQQILLMNDIYSRSRECFVYLGEARNEGKDPKKLVDYIEGHKANILNKWKGDFFIAPGLNSKGSESVWQDLLYDLISKPYFSRIWVVQELFFSKRITCLWGDVSFDWDVISSCAKELPLRQSLATNTAFKKIPAGFVWTRESLEDVNERTSHRKDRRASALEQFTLFTELIDSLASQSQRSLAKLLHATRSFCATDRRDKIFALLNIATDRADFPKADYGWRTEQVFRKFAARLIHRGNAIDVLCESEHRAVAERFSWAPDWSRPYLTWNYERESCFKAGGRPPRTLPVLEERRLRLSACKLDRIRVVCQYESIKQSLTAKVAHFVRSAASTLSAFSTVVESSEDSMEKSLLNLIFCDSVGGLLDPNVDQEKDTRTMTNFLHHLNSRMDPAGWKSLVAEGTQGIMDFFSDADESTRSMLGSLRAAALNVSELEMAVHEKVLYAFKEKGPDYMKFLNRIEKCSRIALTVSNRLALVPASSTVGDVVALLRGARAPMILREHEASEYKFVGQAFVRGVMFGEALQRDEVAFVDLFVI